MDTGNTTYRFAVGVALAAALLLVWLSLGVGIIGRDGDPANIMYFGVLAVGIVGALIARFRPEGMARALFATALAQMSVAAIALIAGLGYPWSGPLELSLLKGSSSRCSSDPRGSFVVLHVGDPIGPRYSRRRRPAAPGVGAERLVHRPGRLVSPVCMILAALASCLLEVRHFAPEHRHFGVGFGAEVHVTDQSQPFREAFRRR